MRAAEYIIKFLEEKDARIVYGLPGYNILEIYEAIRKSNLEHVLVKHEHSAAVMADVTGRLTLKPGVCLVTAGPGALNAATGVAAAYTAASPMLHITGHCSSREKVQPYHGVEDWLFLEKIFANITKWSKTVDNALELPYHMEKAYHIATSGRKGPVHISLAMDILEVDIQKTLNTYKGEIQFELKNAARRIAKKLMELEKPIIVAGKGVLRENSTMEIEELMEKTYIPTLASRRSRDVIPFNNKLNIGYTIIVGFGNVLEDLRKFLEEADGIITVGLDRGERESRDIMELSKSKRIIHLYQEEPPYVEIIEDNGKIIEINTPNLKQLLEELIREVNGYRSKWTNLENRIAELKGKVESDLKEHAHRFSEQKPIHPAYLVQTIKEMVKNDDVIFAIDVGGSSSWAELYLRQNKPNTLLTSDRFGNMGFTLPAAIAANKVKPEANVIGITGDGGMLMTLGEIATAVEQKSNIKIIVMNDRQYTMIKNIQRSRHGYPPFQVDIHTPNFNEIAKSFGANGIKVDDPRDLSAMLEEALNVKGPTIIDVYTTNEYENYRYRL